MSTVSGAAHSTGGSARVILLIVGLMIAAQAATRYFGVAGSATCAGPGRGDLRLPRTALPETLDGWQVTSFTPPQQEDVPGVIGWTHSWSFSRDPLQVIVAFDQVGFMGWHELTRCYEATGWVLADRTVGRMHSDSSEVAWDYVEARLTKLSGEEATLIYSIFNGVGRPAAAPADRRQDKAGVLQRIAGRVVSETDQTSSREAARCLQCQVMVPHQGPLSRELHDDLLKLHAATREMLRVYWLNARSPGSAEKPLAADSRDAAERPELASGQQ